MDHMNEAGRFTRYKGLSLDHTMIFMRHVIQLIARDPKQETWHDPFPFLVRMKEMLDDGRATQSQIAAELGSVKQDLIRLMLQRVARMDHRERKKLAKNIADFRALGINWDELRVISNHLKSADGRKKMQINR